MNEKDTQAYRHWLQRTNRNVSFESSEAWHSALEYERTRTQSAEPFHPVMQYKFEIGHLKERLSRVAEVNGQSLEALQFALRHIPRHSMAGLKIDAAIRAAEAEKAKGGE